jgi:hypothetical protein
MIVNPGPVACDGGRRRACRCAGSLSMTVGRVNQGGGGAAGLSGAVEAVALQEVRRARARAIHADCSGSGRCQGGSVIALQIASTAAPRADTGERREEGGGVDARNPLHSRRCGGTVLAAVPVLENGAGRGRGDTLGDRLLGPRRPLREHPAASVAVRPVPVRKGA